MVSPVGSLGVEMSGWGVGVGWGVATAVVQTVTQSRESDFLPYSIHHESFVDKWNIKGRGCCCVDLV